MRVKCYGGCYKDLNKNCLLAQFYISNVSGGDSYYGQVPQWGRRSADNNIKWLQHKLNLELWCMWLLGLLSMLGLLAQYEIHQLLPVNIFITYVVVLYLTWILRWFFKCITYRPINILSFFCRDNLLLVTRLDSSHTRRRRRRHVEHVSSFQLCAAWYSIMIIPVGN